MNWRKGTVPPAWWRSVANQGGQTAATQQQAIIGLFIYMMPAVLLSGYATPVANMPDWLQALNESNPIMHFIVISNAVYMKDAPAELFFHHTWPMAVIAVVTLTAGAWLFRRRVS